MIADDIDLANLRPIAFRDVNEDADGIVRPISYGCGYRDAIFAPIVILFLQKLLSMIVQDGHYP